MLPACLPYCRPPPLRVMFWPAVMPRLPYRSPPSLDSCQGSRPGAGSEVEKGGGHLQERAGCRCNPRRNCRAGPQQGSSCPRWRAPGPSASRREAWSTRGRASGDAAPRRQSAAAAGAASQPRPGCCTRLGQGGAGTHSATCSGVWQRAGIAGCAPARHAAAAHPAPPARPAHLSTHASGSTTQPRCCSRCSLASCVPGVSLATYLQYKTAGSAGSEAAWPMQ